MASSVTRPVDDDHQLLDQAGSLEADLLRLLIVMGLWLAFLGWRPPTPVDDFSASSVNLPA